MNEPSITPCTTNFVFIGSADIIPPVVLLSHKHAMARICSYVDMKHAPKLHDFQLLESSIPSIVIHLSEIRH
jgi:hypothetical protein